jgi:glycosyltransferase involved in cell wall biosynthesis
VVVPAFNEASTIGRVVQALVSAYPRVVVVDDGSTDDTAGRARAAGATVLRHVLNRGQGAALETGLQYGVRSGARVLVTFDADGQHLPEDIPRLVAPILEGRAEVVLGSRFRGTTEAMPPARRLVLRGAILFTRLTSGLRVTDAHNGLRAFSRRAAQTIEITLDRMAHASELLDQIRRSRLSYVEVPVRIRYTAYSRGKGQSSLAAIPVAVDYLLGRVLK